MIEGILGIRTWRSWRPRDISYSRYTTTPALLEAYLENREYSKCKGVLRSLFVDYTWESETIESNKIPSLVNEEGIYADPIKLEYINKDIVGIIELKGKILIHSDGILRGQWAKIIKLFIHQEIADYNSLLKLGNIYNTPIVVTNNTEESFKHWCCKNSELIRRNHSLTHSLGYECKPPKVIQEFYEVC